MSNPFTIPAGPTDLLRGRPVSHLAPPAEAPDTSVARLLERIPRTDGRPAGMTAMPDEGPSVYDERPGQLPGRTNERPLTERPDWHSVATPPAVAERWAAVVALQDRADELREEHRATPAAETAERREVEAAMRTALAAGRSADKAGPALTDWPRRRLALAAEHGHTVDRLREARAAYDRAVREETPGWWASAVEAVGPALDRARELSGPALAAVAEWRSRVVAAQAMRDALEPDRPAPYVGLDLGEQVAAGHRAPEALAWLLSSEDPPGDRCLPRRARRRHPAQP